MYETTITVSLKKLENKILKTSKKGLRTPQNKIKRI